MTPMQQISQHLLTLPETFCTREVAAALDMEPMKVSMSLKQLHHTGAIMATRRGPKREGNIYVVADRSKLQARVDVYVVADRSKLQARVDGALKAGRPPRQEPEYLTYAVDHDGDLQIIKPDGEAFTVTNQNARRLVAFVSLQASAILMAAG